MLVPAASTLVAVALPAIMAEFALGAAAIGWLVTGYLVLTAVLQPLAGRAGDRIGHRRLLLAGAGLLAVASLAAGLATALVPLVAARLLQGVAGALVVPCSLALVRRRLPAAGRGRAVGRLLAGMVVGGILGVAGGGALVDGGGWRAAFVGLGVLAAAAAVLAAVVVPGEWRVAGPVPARTPAPTPAHAHRWRRLAAPVAGIALTNLALYVALLALPLHLAALGRPAATSGALLGGLLGTAALGALAESRLSRRAGRAGALGAACLAAGVALGLMPAVPGPAWLLAALAVSGAGLGMASSGLLTLGLDAARTGAAGTASGVLSTARYAGSIAGSALLPAVLAVGGHTGAMLLAGAAALAVAPLVWWCGAPRPRPAPGPLIPRAGSGTACARPARPPGSPPG